MIPEGQTVDTLAVTAVLIAYNWPKNTDRYQRVQKFVEAFFPRISEFRQAPRHSKWREANLAANLPGWNRFVPAEAWIRNRRSQKATAQVTSVPPGPEPQDGALYQEFLKWKRARQGN